MEDSAYAFASADAAVEEKESKELSYVQASC
jgi:hypothetical protein